MHRLIAFQLVSEYAGSQFYPVLNKLVVQL